MSEKGFVQKDLQIRVALAPYYLNSPLNGIKHFLNNNLFRFFCVTESFVLINYYRYSEELGGILISYWNLKHESKGRILYETPSIIFKVTVTALCFCPEKGSTIGK